MRVHRVFSLVVTFFLALCLVFATSVINSASAAGDVIKWRVQSHWPAASSSYEASLQVLADRLKERTNGRLILQPYPSGALVPAKEVFNAVKRGMVQMGTISPAYVRDQIQVAGIAAGQKETGYTRKSSDPEPSRKYRQCRHKHTADTDSD